MGRPLVHHPSQRVPLRNAARSCFISSIRRALESQMKTTWPREIPTPIWSTRRRLREGTRCSRTATVKPKPEGTPSASRCSAPDAVAPVDGPRKARETLPLNSNLGMRRERSRQPSGTVLYRDANCPYRSRRAPFGRSSRPARVRREREALGPFTSQITSTRAAAWSRPS